MHIFDGHIHLSNTRPDPEGILTQMNKAGVWGGCVFSNIPKIPGDHKGTHFEEGTDFDTRIRELQAWTKGYEDRLFPVLWIHPDEENILENLDRAVEAGVCAFKIICNNFYVYEEKCMRLLRRMAELGKPVFFHSGILWDGGNSSSYNRPLHWESLISIPGLRFSLGHCSWPWIDECVALYGKFLNGLNRKDSAEMFFDITPGTPRIYRKELFTKLYTVGYDMGSNIFFGTDSSQNYLTDWVKSWLKTDGELLLELGVSREYRQMLYHDNLLRFLGKTDVQVKHILPQEDQVQNWSAVNPETKAVIRKWYQKLNFPKIYDGEFTEALKRIPISDALTPENFDWGCTDGQRSLLSVLFLCEGLSQRYAALGIPEAVLMDTLADIVRWTEVWSRLKGGLFLGELGWLRVHMHMKLFKLGRLQFCMGHAHGDIPGANIRQDDPVMEVHIPDAGPLDPEECDRSFAMAKEFFPKYFPDFPWTVFTCHSWLLDDTLEALLPERSNILTFRHRFTPVEKEPSDAVLGYIFGWRTTRGQVRFLPAESALAKAVKAHIRKDGLFYEALGYIPKES